MGWLQVKMEETLVIYINHEGKCEYGFANRKDWKPIDLDKLKEKNLEFITYSFTNKNGSNKINILEDIAKKFVDEFNNKGYRRLPLSSELIFDLKGEGENL